MSFRVLDPVGDTVVEHNHLARRLETLEGKVIGLLNNGKVKAPELLDMIGAELQERFRLKGVVRGSYQISRAMKPEEWEGIRQCDAVILGTGD